eukprot:4504847-Prymnesium_polylepis.1
MQPGYPCRVVHAVRSLLSSLPCGRPPSILQLYASCPMSRHFCFSGQQPGSQELPGRRLSAPWLRPSAAPGLAEAPGRG